MTRLLGAVLCGGASRRMGVDKATLQIDGVAMARRVADVLVAAGCSPVVAIGGNQTQMLDLGLEFVADDSPGEGPLGGILTALSVAAPALVVACDLPYLRPDTLSAVVRSLGEHDAAVAFTDRAEPLCALWSDSAAGYLRAQFQAGERALHRAIGGLDIAWVKVPLAELRNINMPGDLGSL
jgi:molybdenum cofactor guanylyltransferase